MRVLNVGGGSRDLPAHYDGFLQILLDADKAVEPDLCMDAKDLVDADVAAVDAVYCSHCLEHFYRHEVPKVLAGFMKVLKHNGTLEIIVPDLSHLLKTMADSGLDVEDTYYRAGLRPITFHDVLYGWSKQLESGNEYYAHKCAFTPASLYLAVEAAGFVDLILAQGGPNLKIVAKKCP